MYVDTVVRMECNCNFIIDCKYVQTKYKVIRASINLSVYLSVVVVVVVVYNSL